MAHSDETRRRIGAGVHRAAAERRLRRLARPRDLEQLAEDGWQELGRLHPGLEAALDESLEEHDDLVEWMGGADALSAAQRGIVEDFARLGLLRRLAESRFVATGDPRAIDQCARLISERRQSLRLLEGTRAEPKARSLEEILAGE